MNFNIPMNLYISNKSQCANGRFRRFKHEIQCIPINVKFSCDK